MPGGAGISGWGGSARSGCGRPPLQDPAVLKFFHHLRDDGAQKAVTGLIPLLIYRLKAVEMPCEALPERRCLTLPGTIYLRNHAPQCSEGGQIAAHPPKTLRKMTAQNRPHHYRIRRMVQMVRESAETDYLANSVDFMREFEVSRRTVARDLDFLRDEENVPLSYDEERHDYVLTDETYALPPVNISRREAFSFGLARKLLVHYEGVRRRQPHRQPLPGFRRTGRELPYYAGKSNRRKKLPD